MDTFLQAVAVVSAVCLGTIVVSVFWWLLSLANSFIRPKSKNFEVKQKMIAPDAMVSVKLIHGEPLEPVKFIGYAVSQSTNERPVSINIAHSAVFQNADDERIFVPSMHILHIRELSTLTLAKDS